VNEEYLKKLQALKQQYIHSLPGILQQIQQGTDALASDDMSVADMDEYYRIVHSLIGSGATYGFSEVSDFSRSLENSIKDLADAPSDSREKIIRDIQAWCVLIGRAINTATGSDEE